MHNTTRSDLLPGLNALTIELARLEYLATVTVGSTVETDELEEASEAFSAACAAVIAASNQFTRAAIRAEVREAQA